MSANLACIDSSKRHSYQHLHGVMLVNLNKLASKERLSHTEYRIMGVLIGLWNKNTNKSFPSINYLSELCRMSKSTIIKTLKQLELKELIIINKKLGKRNNYYLSTQIMNINSGTHKKPETILSCETTHVYKQIKIKTDKKITSLVHQKNLNTDDAKFINQILKSWGVCSSKQLIKQYGEKKIQSAIKIVQEKKPDNYGAYLRAILKVPLVIVENKKNLNSSIAINTMLQSKYWKHIPSNKTYMVKPDIGSHLFIKYNERLGEVTFLETGLTDVLTNFEPCKGININDIDKEKPSKQKVLSDMLKNGNTKEVMILKKVWKLKDDPIFE